MAAQIYVNLSVEDLNKSIEFFTKLGFKFNPKFTDENAACMIIGDNIFVMLLLKKFFQSFTKKEICDASKCAEVINAIAVESRDKVDEMITKVAEAGGIETREPQDHGWMYGRSFQDLDGHLWEIFYMEDNTTN